MHSNIQLSAKMHWFILMSAMLLCGIISASQGKDLHFDLLAYHYYSPYALLHHRWNMDYWPPSYLVAFFNPAIDLITYFLIQNFSPVNAEFILGSIQGINFWLVFYISFLLVNTRETKHPVAWSLLLAFIGLYNPITWNELGSFRGDMIVSILVLSSIALHLITLKRYFLTKIVSFNALLASGFLLGLVVGLKLTAGVFLIGFLISLFFLPLPFSKRFTIIFLWGMAATVGFFLSSGYWMALLWQKYHNPFFPLLNSIFQSPDALKTSFIETNFLPNNIAESLLFPLYFSWNSRHVANHHFVDFRFVAVYAFFIVYALTIAWRKYTKDNRPKSNDLSDKLISWFFLFFIFSYIIWQHYFSTLRYLITLEFLSPLIIYLLVTLISKKISQEVAAMATMFLILYICLFFIDHKSLCSAVFLLFLWIACLAAQRYFNPVAQINSILFVVFFSIIFTVKPMMPDKIPARFYGTRYFNVTLPAFVNALPRALVFMVANNYVHSVFNPVAFVPATYSVATMPAKLSAYLIPSFPAGWRFAGVEVTNESVDTMAEQKNPFNYVVSKKLKELVAETNDPIYLLSTEKNMTTFYHFAHALGLKKAGRCHEITSDRLTLEHMQIESSAFRDFYDMKDYVLQLCPVKKEKRKEP